jgi:hypothetical protein
VQSARNLNRDIIDYTGSGEADFKIENNEIQVTADNLEYRFSNENGLLQEVKKGGKIIPLSNGPVILGHKDKVEDIAVNAINGMVEIIVLFEIKEKTPEWSKVKEYSSDSIIWRIHPNGLLDLAVITKNRKRVRDYKGISFSFPETEVAGKKWLGDGPYRVWRNRMKGTQFRVWENDYNNSVTGESGFIYPEFKGFFSSLYWAKVKGKNNNGFTVYSFSPHTFLRMLTPENPSGDANGRVSIDFPDGDISFLKNIPPIGTKFQEPISTGPKGNPENYFGNSDDPLVIKLTFEF